MSRRRSRRTSPRRAPRRGGAGSRRRSRHGWDRIQVPPALLAILAVVALRAGEAERALLEDRVLSVPSREARAEPLADITELPQAVFQPAEPGGPLTFRAHHSSFATPCSQPHRALITSPGWGESEQRFGGTPRDVGGGLVTPRAWQPNLISDSSTHAAFYPTATDFIGQQVRRFAGGEPKPRPQSRRASQLPRSGRCGGHPPAQTMKQVGQVPDRWPRRRKGGLDDAALPEHQ
jgi:hypothetical protein